MAGTLVTVTAADFLKLLLNATPIANIADNATSSALSALFLSLHTADPGASGNQQTSELAYTGATGYARQSIARNNGSPAWTITGASASPTSAVTFDTMTGGAGGLVTFVGLGTLVSGTGKLLLRGALSPSINVVNGIAPQLLTGSTLVFS